MLTKVQTNFSIYVDYWIRYISQRIIKLNKLNKRIFVTKNDGDIKVYISIKIENNKANVKKDKCSYKK